jgi:hypothetical protein
MPRNVDPELIKLLKSMGLANANNTKNTPKPKRNNRSKNQRVPTSLVSSTVRGKKLSIKNRNLLFNALARNATGMSTPASRNILILRSATKGRLTKNQRKIVSNYHGRNSARAYRDRA